MRRSFAVLTSAVLFALAAGGQEHTKSNAGSLPPAVSIHFASSIRLSSLMSLDGIESPINCGSAGAIFFRAGDVNTIIGVARDGSTTKYSASSINDIPNPQILKYFPTSDALYALVLGLTHTGKSYRVRPPGQKVDQAGEVTVPEYYIARFDLSGAYRGVQKLDISFVPAQIGTFSTGDFLVSGIDNDSGEPRLSIVNRRGQFLRNVELEGDITATSEGVKETSKKWAPGGSPRAGLHFMVFTSDLIADRGNLLLVRKQSNVIVHEISPAGDVRRVKIKGITDSGTLTSLKSAEGRWLVQFAKDRPDGMGVTIHSYMVDPEEGRVLERLVYDQGVGFGLACYDGGEVSVLREQDGAVALLKGTMEATKVQSPESTH